MDAADFRGAPLPGQLIVVERSAVSTFATAIGDTNPVFHDATAAHESGFHAMPAPPTFPFVMHTFGSFPELQPAAGDTSPVTSAIGVLMSNGGMILHGEQEFVSHRPVQVGDRLVGAGEIEDVTTKQSGDRVMTFVVARTDWTDESTGEPVCTSRMTIIHRR